MSSFDAGNNPLVAESTRQRPPGVPDEPRLPAGRSLRSVQTQPLPLISHAPGQVEGPRPVPDAQTVRQQVAQSRLEITGSGAIVDTYV